MFWWIKIKKMDFLLNSVPWHLKRLANWLFVKHLVQANNNKNVKALHNRSFVREIHWWLDHQDPVMQKAFPFHDPILVLEHAKGMLQGCDFCPYMVLRTCHLLLHLSTAQAEYHLPSRMQYPTNVMVGSKRPWDQWTISPSVCELKIWYTNFCWYYLQK